MRPLPPRAGPAYLLRYLRDPYGSTLRAFDRVGDPHTLRAFGHDLVVTGIPEHVRTILAADPDDYDAFGVARMAPALGRESLLLLSGPRHRAARKLLSPPFHGARMRAYAGVIREVTREVMAAWPRGRPFAIQDATRTISLRVILRAVLGLREPAQVARFEAEVVAGVDALRPALLWVPGLQRELGGIGPWARFQRRSRAVEALVVDELAARRRDATARDDILSHILASAHAEGRRLTDREVFETMMTLVVAGHETTAIAIAWAMWLLLRHPASLARLRAALAGIDADDADAIAAAPYLDAVCQETLRLQPIAGSIARVLRRPMALAGHEVPAGACVSASIIALHRRPDLYPDPGAFRPERFLERRFGPHELMPFGGGHRRCIGAAFALYEMKLVLATFLSAGLELRLARPGDAIGEVPRATVIAPRRPILVIAEDPGRGGAAGAA